MSTKTLAVIFIPILIGLCIPLWYWEESFDRRGTVEIHYVGGEDIQKCIRLVRDDFQSDAWTCTAGVDYAP